MLKTILTIVSTVAILSALGNQRRRIRTLECELAVVNEIADSAITDLHQRILSEPSPVVLTGRYSNRWQ